MSGEGLSSLFSTVSPGECPQCAFQRHLVWNSHKTDSVCETLSPEEPGNWSPPLPEDQKERVIQRRGCVSGPFVPLFIVTQVWLRRFTYILSWGGAEVVNGVARGSSSVPVVTHFFLLEGPGPPKRQAQEGAPICCPISWLSAHSHCFEGILGKPEPQSTPGSHWERKTHAAGATKWHGQQLPACLPPATSAELRRLQPKARP